MGDPEQHAAGERIACSDGINGFHGKPVDVVGRAVFDNVATLFTARDKGEVASPAQFGDAFIEVIGLKKVMSFVQVAKHNISVIRDDFLEVIGESIDQKTV